MLVLILCCSCQVQKDKTEQSINLNKTERLGILYLFDDLYKAVRCDEKQALIESNKILQDFGRQYDFPQGYLFDIFSNISKLEDKSTEKMLVSGILNVWKTVASMELINDIVSEVSRCYPEEYLGSKYKRRSSSRRRSSSSSSSSSTNNSTNICDKTQVVQKFILRIFQTSEGPVLDCNTVTLEDLKTIKVFNMVHANPETLKPDDFNGLSSVTSLFLDNNNLNSLPAGIFNGLNSVEYIYLRNNNLSSLPAGIFNNLSNLKAVTLSNNNFSTAEQQRIRAEVDSSVSLFFRNN